MAQDVRDHWAKGLKWMRRINGTRELQRQRTKPSLWLELIDIATMTWQLVSLPIITGRGSDVLDKSANKT